VKAGSDLRADHRVIRRLEYAIRKMSARIARGEKLPPEDVEEAIGLMMEFVDAYHHAKEEVGLFPVVQGVARGEQKTVYGFLVEHEFGRRAAMRIEQEYVRWAKGEETAESLSRFMLTYADFIRAHTSKEDAWFEAVDGRLLSAEQQREVLGRFSRVEKNPQAKKEFARRVNRLAVRYSGRRGKGDAIGGSHRPTEGLP